MTISDIAALPFSEMKKHINLLDDEYHKRTGRRVCRSCSGDVQFMINYLKNLKDMSKFELKNPVAIYRMQKGRAERITQSILTDDMAIEYLSINPERIVLFGRYPDNWEQLIGLAPEDEAEDEECSDCLRDKLNKISMKKLKADYPEIPIIFAMKKADLIDEIVKLSEVKK